MSVVPSKTIVFRLLDMIIKITYGLQHSLPFALQPHNAGKVQCSNFNFHHSTPCISMSDALADMKDGTTIEDREILLDVVVSSNKELILTINTMVNIGFLKSGDEIEVCAYIPNEASYKNYEELDLKYVRAETGHQYIGSTTYRIEGESSLNDILKAKNVIRSKSWNIAGEIYDDEGETQPIKPQKPVEFKELRNLIKEVCAHMTNEDYELIASTCVEVKNGHDFSEEGDGWRDFSYYQVRMTDFEKALDKLGYLIPFLRKIAVDAILADLD